MRRAVRAWVAGVMDGWMAVLLEWVVCGWLSGPVGFWPGGCPQRVGGLGPPGVGSTWALLAWSRRGYRAVTAVTAVTVPVECRVKRTRTPPIRVRRARVSSG